VLELGAPAVVYSPELGVQGVVYAPALKVQDVLWQLGLDDGLSVAECL
jgi:hypothetical protein